VTFRYKDAKTGQYNREMTLAVIGFIRRFMQHILPPGDDPGSYRVYPPFHAAYPAFGLLQNTLFRNPGFGKQPGEKRTVLKPDR